MKPSGCNRISRRAISPSDSRITMAIEIALAEFEIVKRELPNEAQAYSAIAAIQRRQGK